jgi:hypothetical protein
MGYYKQLQIFWQNNPKLTSHESQDYFDVGTKLGLTFVSSLTSPCPDCKKIRTRKPGQRYWHCFYCGMTDIADATGENARINLELEKAEKARKQKQALELWNESVSIIGTAGERYLNSRKLELPPNPNEVLRWHPRCLFGLRHQPCMVALFRNAVTDKPVAVHRTCIATGERMALGPIARAAIKLWPLGSNDTLAVGEGIETVLAAVKLGHADPPAWATSVANNLSVLPVIKGVRRLVVLADNDASRTGEKMARELRRNWVNKEVVIRMPAESGADFNDLLRRSS